MGKDKRDNMGKKYGSVSAMVKDLSDKKFTDDFDKHLANRKIVKKLAILRVQHGLSEADLAKNMNCTEEVVIKMEEGTDNELQFMQLKAYIAALTGE